MKERFASKLAEFIAQHKCINGNEIRKRLHRSKCSVTLSPPRVCELSPEEVYERSVQSVFLLESQTMSATAWALTEDGVFVTNRHVFEQLSGKDCFGVMNYKGETFPVIDVLAASREADVAIFRVGGSGFRPLAISADTKVGAWVGVLSNPGGQHFTFTQGHVTRYSKTITDGLAEKSMGITAEYALGSSGGPVLDKHGAVAGMATRSETIFDDEPADASSSDVDSEVDDERVDASSTDNPEETKTDDSEKETKSNPVPMMIVKTAVPAEAILKMLQPAAPAPGR